ncbi:hypothetical protein POM88_033560 [Heracleum sosnowskyi]|uniref:Uncharacterized protein n=1 Tax=Heracleum sosnowskyi TaxID=360622 RepID=A0AAD8I3H0_9APIA|nr:hypothetical protein POM88_033560 [Heracleum sosnowskyi]
MLKRGLHSGSLSLHTNFFNGSVPDSSISGCLNLKRFEIQDNGFSGNFHVGIWSLPKIRLIRAENNRFSGKIPESISMAKKLEQVQIDNNTFISKLPQGLGQVEKGQYKAHYHFELTKKSKQLHGTP